MEGARQQKEKSGPAVTNLPAAAWTQAQPLGQEDPPEKERAAKPIFLPGNPMDGGAGRAPVHGVTKDMGRTEWLHSAKGKSDRVEEWNRVDSGDPFHSKIGWPHWQPGGWGKASRKPASTLGVDSAGRWRSKGKRQSEQMGVCRTRLPGRKGSRVSEPQRGVSEWPRSSVTILLWLSPEHQCFGRLMQWANALEKTLLLGRPGGRRERGQQRMRWRESVAASVDVTWSQLRETEEETAAWHAPSTRSQSRTRPSDRTTFSGGALQAFAITYWGFNIRERLWDQFQNPTNDAVWGPWLLKCPSLSTTHLRSPRSAYPNVRGPHTLFWTRTQLRVLFWCSLFSADSQRASWLKKDEYS